MPSPQCDIEFDDNPLGYYYSGQRLSGRVILQLEGPKNVYGFKLVIKGFAEVKWTKQEKRQSDKETRTITYRGEEQILRSETALLNNNGAEVQLAAGTHVYNFACELPPTLSSSFEGKLGFIRYKAKAVLDIPWRFDKSCEMAFTVIKHVDLNLEDPLRHPVKYEKTKKFCCWPCTSQPLYIIVEVPKSGFVSREKIPITVTLENNSDVAVSSITCKVVQNAAFTSLTPKRDTKYHSKVVASITEDMSEANDHDQKTIHLELPFLVPTGECSVIAVGYDLQVEIDVNGFHLNPSIKIPITIGTVPLLQSTLEMPSAPLLDENGTADTSKSVPVALTAGGSALLPPSYEEAVYGPPPMPFYGETSAVGRQNTNTAKGPVIGWI